MVSWEGWGEGHQLEDMGWAGREVLCEPEEVCQGVVDASGNRYTFDFDMVEGLPHLAEEASCAGKGNYHQPQISKDLVPCVHNDLLLGR